MKILFVSLGCDKNLVDTEVMLGMLSNQGYTFTDDEGEADIVVINTCCFIHDAKEESIQVILDMAELKKQNEIKVLLVTGCLAERYREEIQKEIPEVDAILGTASIEQIADAVEESLNGKARNQFASLDTPPLGGQKRIVTTGGYYSYLKIAEGCEKHCTYCIIPKVRGNYRSVVMEDLVKEAQALAEGGVKELILVAQETTLYGVDLYGKKTLPELLRRLCNINGIEWIRILYCYPEEITEELVQVIAEEPKICNYLDIPIQHASDTILRRMGRRTDRKHLEDLIAMLRERIPDLCLRTTLITGFPGETEEDHEQLMDFVNAMEFDRLGVFTYSQEEDTPAAEMPGQISDDVKEERRNEIMELQQDIAFDLAEDMVGRKLYAIVEGKVSEENAYVARTYRDAPNVDGYLFIQTTKELMSGDFVRVQVTGSHEYDLIGELCDEFTK